MMRWLKSLWQSPVLKAHIGRRLAILIVAFSALVTLLVSSVQLLNEYRNLRTGIERQLDDIRSATDTIAASVWDFDERQILLALEGLLRLPNIEQARVIGIDADIGWSAGAVDARDTVTRQYTLRVTASPEPIGRLEVIASLDGVNAQIWNSALFILLANGLSALCLALFMLYVFRQMISRRLAELRVRVTGLAGQPASGNTISDELGGIPAGLDEIAAVDWIVTRTGTALEEANRRRELAQAKLRRSEEYLRILVEQAPDAILVFDVDLGCYIAVNPAAEQLFEVSRQELTSGDIDRFYQTVQADGSSPAESRRLIMARALAGEVVRAERWIVTALGKHRICETLVVQLPSSQRRLLRLSMIDITARKEAETSLANLNLRLQGLLDSALEISIISTDLEGHITVFSKGAERLLGYSAAEMIGQTPALIHRESEVKLRARELSRQLGRPVSGFETFVALVNQGGSEIRNWTYVRKDGSHLRVSLVVNAVFDRTGHVIGYMGIARDISEQLEAEAKQLKLTIGLDNLVRQRTLALETALQELQEAKNKLVESEKLAALGSLVSAVAHELNTPIGNCVTVASTLAEKTTEFQAMVLAGQLRRSALDSYLATNHEAMQILQRGLARSSMLIDRFKQVAVDRSGFERKSFSLDQLLNSMHGLLMPHLQGLPHQLEIAPSPATVMTSYPQVIEQVLLAMFENVLAHAFVTVQNGRITLAASGDNERIQLRFADNGVGMSEHTLKHVFDPFYTTQLGKGSSGLGMYICYNLVTRLLDGTITVASSPGEGCCYTIDMPVVVAGASN